MIPSGQKRNPKERTTRILAEPRRSNANDPASEQPSKQIKFWNYIKSLRKDNCRVSPLKDKGKLHAESIDKANILNKQ
jgi:hypothetical protein